MSKIQQKYLKYSKPAQKIWRMVQEIAMYTSPRVNKCSNVISFFFLMLFLIMMSDFRL